MVDDDGNPVLDEDGEEQRVMEDVEQIDGCPNPKWLEEHGLNEDSHPVEFLDSFLPIYNKSNKSGKTPFKVSVELLKNWSNAKAKIMNMGTPSYYPKFVPFELLEFEQFMHLYMLQGLCPSPRIEYKFKSNVDDPVHGNDWLRRSMKTSQLDRRLREFKCCFAVQDPYHPIPPKKTHPNWKVDPFLEHIQAVSMYAWSLGRDLAGDEQTIGFKGRSEFKKRITYKKEGDGFQADALCDDGYTYCFYFRNQSAPKKYLKEGLSPLHSRCMALFDCLPNSYHQVRFDNLYMSAKFALAAYCHPNKVMVEGVTRTNARGIPRQVLQYEAQAKEDQARLRGTTKAAVLSGVPALEDCPLVACSVYDSKPVHFLTTCAERIKWITKSKPVYDKTSGIVRDAEFLRLSINDSYNNKMNKVDQADQLRGNYRPDRFSRQYKWWWAIYFWGYGTIHVNAYVIYRRVRCKKGKKPLSQYDFRRAIVLAKIDPEDYAPLQKISASTTKYAHKKTRAGKSISKRSEAEKKKREAAKVGATTRRVASKKRETVSEYINDDALHPQGHLSKRLNRGLPHMFDPVAKEDVKGKCCGLCRWATGLKKMAQLVHCDDCNVTLCTWCWRPFHTVEDLHAIKEELEEKCLERALKRKNNLSD